MGLNPSGPVPWLCERPLPHPQSSFFIRRTDVSKPTSQACGWEASGSSQSPWLPEGAWQMTVAITAPDLRAVRQVWPGETWPCGARGYCTTQGSACSCEGAYFAQSHICARSCLLQQGIPCQGLPSYAPQTTRAGNLGTLFQTSLPAWLQFRYHSREARAWEQGFFFFGSMFHGRNLIAAVEAGLGRGGGAPTRAAERWDRTRARLGGIRAVGLASWLQCWASGLHDSSHPRFGFQQLGIFAPCMRSLFPRNTYNDFHFSDRICFQNISPLQGQRCPSMEMLGPPEGFLYRKHHWTCSIRDKP